MSNILLVNDNVQDYNIIINACNDITYAITYNQQTDTYDTIFTKYENIVAENNIQVLNHLALVSHGSNNPEFTFLEKENKMLISQYLVDPSVNPYTVTSPSENVENEIPVSIAGPHEDILPLANDDPEDILAEDDPEDIVERGLYPEDILPDSSLNSMNKKILNNLDTWTSFKEFIKKFNIQISLDFLGCALLQSVDWKYVLETLETEQHLHLTMRASDDATGNLKVGANWVLESDNVNIKELYFNGVSIEKWTYILTAYNFTNLNGGSSYTGPTSAAGYNGTPSVTIDGGIQQWVVPTTGSYSIEAWGASGGDGTVAGDGHGSAPHASSNRYGGTGRYVKITTTLTKDQVIYILVGQGGHRNYTRCGGGGGGTFVTTAKGNSTPTSAILVIAGGGGGGGRGYGSGAGQSPEINARGVNANGGYSYDYHTSGNINPGGTGGSGGQYAGGSSRQGQGSTGGGGFIGDGTKGYSNRSQDVGQSFRNGGVGGQGSVSGSDYGGFGGGGSQPHQNHVGGGGGGGYNGGAPGGNYNGAWSGGGGSSYAAETPDNDEEWDHSRSSIVTGPGRHGKVTIANAGPPPPTPPTPPPSPISLSTLKSLYIASGITSATGHSNLATGLYSFTTHTFTNCTASGRYGPTLTNCMTTYGTGNNWWNNTNYFYVLGDPNIQIPSGHQIPSGIQIWTVPRTGDYQIEAVGASGGDTINTNPIRSGGKGAKMNAVFSLLKGDKYMILIGQMGKRNDLHHPQLPAKAGSGGGGTFFVKGSHVLTIPPPYPITTLIVHMDQLLIAAGGGGGAGGVVSYYNPGRDALSNGNTTSGIGGWGDGSAGGGGGFLASGQGGGSRGTGVHHGGSTHDGFSPLHTGVHGGFGGGGGADSINGGGAGGSFGGDGTGSRTTGGATPEGGGGGSHIDSTGSSGSGSVRSTSGHGYLTITATTAVIPTVKLSYFRGATFTSGDPVPSSGAISVDTVFRDRTFGGAELYTFTSHTFTNCGQTGRYGPSISQCQNTYSSESWTLDAAYFSVSSGLQKWTVPVTGSYSIDAYGARGGRGYHSSASGYNLPGIGVRMTGTFSLTKNDVIWIGVGQKGFGKNDGSASTYPYAPGAGGGGSFIVKASPSSATESDILVIAGGGGGAGQNGRGTNGGHATTATHDTRTASAAGSYATGPPGKGGDPSTMSPYPLGFSGAGFEEDGKYGGTYAVSNFNDKPRSYTNSAGTAAEDKPLVGGRVSTWFKGEGGFGGGGGTGLGPGGGGGGYSGGDTYGTWGSSGMGYGGGSKNTGTNQSSSYQATPSNGHGKVIITLL